jgi:hypothetical protein
MQLKTHRSNAGQFHWCLVGDDVRLHAGSAAGTEERR